jgi:glycerophosphoryl diester phosphodiesterase
LSRSFDVAKHVYAHRGIWGGAIPENSLAAFRAAAAKKVGCELDVRFTRDHELVVFHDPTLQRLCGDGRSVDALTLDELSELRLPDGGAIPTLLECLKAMAGQPVLIELKVERTGTELPDAVADLIAGFDGPCAVMSFDPMTVERLRQKVTDRPVGLLIAEKERTTSEGLLAAAARGKEIGCDYLGPHTSSLAIVRAGTKLPLVTWTVRDVIRLDVAKQFGAAPIFEGFSAEVAKSGGTPI